MRACVRVCVVVLVESCGQSSTHQLEMTYESAQTRVFLQDYLCNLLLTSRNVYVKSKVCWVGGVSVLGGWG